MTDTYRVRLTVETREETVADIEISREEFDEWAAGEPIDDDLAREFITASNEWQFDFFKAVDSQGATPETIDHEVTDAWVKSA